MKHKSAFAINTRYIFLYYAGLRISVTHQVPCCCFLPLVHTSNLLFLQFLDLGDYRSTQEVHDEFIYVIHFSPILYSVSPFLSNWKTQKAVCGKKIVLGRKYKHFLATPGVRARAVIETYLYS